MAALLLLGACAPRGAITLAPEAADTGTVVDILVATSRGRDAEGGIGARERADTLAFGAFGVSVPPERAPGTVAFPRGAANPITDFLTVSAAPIADEGRFVAALDAALGRRAPPDREIWVFVPGFNVNFAEGLYRQAQMAHDFGSPGVPVFYSWPSAGSVLAYPFDRESALFARDGLERAIDLAARSRARDMILVGHSMGALVVMEAVRQLALRGAGGTLARMQAVVLIAPDLDVDVFRGQLAALPEGAVPIYIVTSGRDRALRLSSGLRGGTDRLGAVRMLDRVAELPGVLVIDVTDVEGSDDPLNHFAVATSPAMIAMIRGLDRFGLRMLRDQDRPGNVLEATVNVVSGVTEVVLRPLEP